MTENALSDFDRRRDFIGLQARDLQSLRSMDSLIERELPGALDKLYAKIRETPDARRFFSSEAQIEHAKNAQKSHWRHISAAQFDHQYVENVRRIGSAHARIGLEPSLYIGSYGLVLDYLIDAIIHDERKSGFWGRHAKRRADSLIGKLSSLSKAVFLEIDLTISSYMDDINKARAQMQAEQDRHAEEDRAAIETLGKALNALAEGDLTQRIGEDDVPPRLLALRQHFNQTAATLEETMNRIATEAAHIVSNVTDIRQGADQLSSRTEQQAAAGEEMSAALSQIAERVRQTAEETRKTDQRVAVAWQEAKHADTVRNDTMAAMAAIESSSREIGGIIGMMNEVAFQTNILALNASVEAARAGDVGRGFAVVASEVRALSQRSADAAEAISSLVRQSGDHVKSGVMKVQEAGGALQRVMDQVREISSAVSTISSSTQGQSRSITELNVAMAELEQTTLKNANAAGESAEAVRNLFETADSLTQMVAHFTVASRCHTPLEE